MKAAYNSLQRHSSGNMDYDNVENCSSNGREPGNGRDVRTFDTNGRDARSFDTNGRDPRSFDTNGRDARSFDTNGREARDLVLTRNTRPLGDGLGEPRLLPSLCRTSVPLSHLVVPQQSIPVACPGVVSFSSFLGRAPTVVPSASSHYLPTVSCPPPLVSSLGPYKYFQ